MTTFEFHYGDVLLSIRNVSLEIDGVAILDDVNADVTNIVRPGLSQGQVVGFLGPSGCGKTSLLRVLAGLVAPTNGDVRVRTADAGADDDDGMSVVAAGDVGVVAQSYPLFAHRSVWSNLLVAAAAAGLDDDAAEERAMTLLERFDLVDKRNRYPIEVSGGQRQRIAIAQQLMRVRPHGASFLLMDEPFSGLDPVNAEAMKDAVLDQRRQGTTIVFSTHDMGVAEKLCDRIFMIFKGRKVLDGTLEEIQSSYGHDTLVVQTAAGAAALAGLPGVEAVNDRGNFQEVRLGPAARAAENRLTARVTSVQFQGAFTRLTLAGVGADGLALSCDVAATALAELGVKDGAEVAVALPPDAVRAFVEPPALGA